VAQLTKLLVHYGCRLGLGIQMSVTMEVLLTKLGMSPQPLQASYADYGKWVTNTWLKSVWEKVYKFNITVEIALLPIKPPREGDKWFMQAVIESGLTNAEELIQINHYRCHQQVLFVSEVLDASGKAIDKQYLECRKDHINWSVLIFPIENPPRKNLKLWQQVLYSLAPRGRVQQQVGHFLTKGHKIWEWRYNESAQRVYHIKGNVMDIYTPSVLPQFENRWNCWTRSRIEVPAEELGDTCTVRKVALAVYSVVSSCTGPPFSAPLLDF
jgi:hypothetical protein